MKKILLACWVLCLSSPAFAYVLKKTNGSEGQPVRWFKKEIVYKISPNVKDKFGDDGIAAIKRAFSTWEKQLSGKLAFKYDGMDTQNTTQYNDKEREKNVTNVYIDENWSTVEVLALTYSKYNAETGELWDSDIALNPNFKIVVFKEKPKPSNDNAWDFESIVFHEIGHLLGLGHSESADAVMNEKQKPFNLEKRALHQDDKDGLVQLYEKIPFPEKKEEPKIDNTIKKPTNTGAFGCSVANRETPLWFFLLFLPFIFIRKKSK